MALVTLSTIYQTVFIALVLIISKGWNIIRNTLHRQDLSGITLMMGAIYLVYSAYYVSVNVEGMMTFLLVILNVLYIVLFAYVLKNTLQARLIIKH
jgi:hypothetical protein